MRRRTFLASLAAATSLAQSGWAAAGSPAFLAAARLPAGDYAVLGLTGQGEEIFRLALPARGHAGAAHPNQPIAVAFARRPGVFGLVIDCVHGAVIAQLEPQRGGSSTGMGRFPPMARGFTPPKWSRKALKAGSGCGRSARGGGSRNSRAMASARMRFCVCRIARIW